MCYRTNFNYFDYLNDKTNEYGYSEDEYDYSNDEDNESV
jgi:hypothetical protein